MLTTRKKFTGPALLRGAAGHRVRPEEPDAFDAGVGEQLELPLRAANNVFDAHDLQSRYFRVAMKLLLNMLHCSRFVACCAQELTVE